MEIKNKRKLNDRRWAQLLKEIDRGNVVLVIGQELLSINVDGEQVLLKDYILREIANRLGVIYEEGMDFSNFSFDERKTAWERIDSDPYYETYKIINELKEKLKPYTSTKIVETIQIHSIDDDALISLVEQGLGVSILPGLSLKDISENVCVLPLKPELKRKLGIMMPRSVREQVQTFVDFVHHLDISKY